MCLECEPCAFSLLTTVFEVDLLITTHFIELMFERGKLLSKWMEKQSQGRYVFWNTK